MYPINFITIEIFRSARQCFFSTNYPQRPFSFFFFLSPLPTTVSSPRPYYYIRPWFTSAKTSVAQDFGTGRPASPDCKLRLTKSIVDVGDDIPAVQRWMAVFHAPRQKSFRVFASRTRRTIFIQFAYYTYLYYQRTRTWRLALYSSSVFFDVRIHNDIDATIRYWYPPIFQPNRIKCLWILTRFKNTR